MKKIILFVVALLSFSMAANAIVFPSTQSLCKGTEQIIMYRSGSFSLYDDGVEVYSGSYEVETSSKVIILYVEGKRLRCPYASKDGRTVSSLTFRGNIYYPCRR